MICDAVFSAAQSASLVPWKEFPSLIPGCQYRPADVFLPHWDRGLPAALDISVISILQQRTVHGAAEKQGYALPFVKNEKWPLMLPVAEQWGFNLSLLL